MSHWLLPSESHLWVNDIHSDFVGFGCSAVNIPRNLLTGRPYGGVACLSDIAASVSMTKGLYNDRLCGIHLSICGRVIYILSQCTCLQNIEMWTVMCLISDVSMT